MADFEIGAVTAPVAEFETIDSTNSEAMRRAAQGERGPLWIVARRQSSGRGRSERAWQSPVGNLSATFLFDPGCPPEAMAQVSFVAGIAAHRACVASLRPPVHGGIPVVELKWPNDVLIDGAKVCGILVEATRTRAGAVACIGFGVNVAVAPPVDGRAVTCLAAHGATDDPTTVRARIATALDHTLSAWRSGEGFADIRSEWLSRSIPIGRPMSVNAADGRISGAFDGIDADGALIVREPTGRLRRLTHGDVSLENAPREGPTPGES